jgi:hypothetical protein
LVVQALAVNRSVEPNRKKPILRCPLLQPLE